MPVFLWRIVSLSLHVSTLVGCNLSADTHLLLLLSKPGLTKKQKEELFCSVDASQGDLSPSWYIPIACHLRLIHSFIKHHSSSFNRVTKSCRWLARRHNLPGNGALTSIFLTKNSQRRLVRLSDSQGCELRSLGPTWRNYQETNFIRWAFKA